MIKSLVILVSIALCLNAAPFNGETPNGIVPYVIDPYTYNATELNIILAGMKIIEDQTRVNGKDCIKFVPRSSEATYLRIFNGQGCWSYVGRQQRGGAQQLSLQKPSATVRGSCIYKSTVAHELIHALGFWHEQSRPDRDQYIRINWENISVDDQHNFNKYPTTVSDPMEFPYDYHSIMHYDSHAFSINGKPTMEVLQSGWSLISVADDLKRDSISTIDAGELMKYYGCI
ncbi:unnamed protein product [Brachionus calyciflorus]|uniref:Metalloendopeptidase n=1 Tax=Brachionus calyciflorus TaxID=104777 RepID=A0A813XMD6_9BILA|nr:unnamed protein product [Brachionus calyciflorus]